MLTKCPECSNEVSDKATSCPKCGHPLQAAASREAGDVDTLIKQTLSHEGKIAAIKLYRNYNPSAGLADAKQYVERLEAGLSQGTATTATLAPSPILRQSQEVPSAAIIISLVVVVAFCIGLYFYYAGPSASGGSGTSVPKLFETQYKVTLPSGDIVTMSESELVEYNKKMIKERQEAVQKFTNELHDISKKLEQDLKDLKK